MHSGAGTEFPLESSVRGAYARLNSHMLSVQRSCGRLRKVLLCLTSGSPLRAAFLWASGDRSQAEDEWETLQNSQDGLGGAIYSKVCPI